MSAAEYTKVFHLGTKVTIVGLLKSSGHVALNNPPRCGQTAWPRKRRKAAPVKHIIEFRAFQKQLLSTQTAFSRP